MARLRGSDLTTTKIDKRLKEIFEDFDITMAATIRDFATQVLESTIELSPLGPYENGKTYPLPRDYTPGRFITNWQVRLGNNDNSTREPVGSSAREDAFVRGVDVISNYSGSDAISFKGNTFKVGETITIFNNTKYREQVEVDGWIEGWRMPGVPASGAVSTPAYEPVSEVAKLIPFYWENAKRRNNV